MSRKFITCGIIGWCIEDLWTGLCSCTSKDKKLSCKTSLWMFPIYGNASLIKPVSQLLQKHNFIVRGFFYMLCIFSAEFISGSILKKFDMCPWDYSDAPLNYKGIVRLDFAPLWFCVGLLYEFLLNYTPNDASK